MNDTPTPHHPADEYGGPDIDLVPGIPPVPITVWRTPRRADQPAIGDRLAYRLLVAYTAPGETVVDLTDAPALAHAATVGDRTHLRAAFDPRQTIIVMATTPARGTRRHVAREWRVQLRRGEPVALSDWFGDDLADTAARTTHTADRRRPAAATDRADLIVAAWPLHKATDIHTTRLTHLAAAAATILRPGGCLVLIAASRFPAGDFTTLVTGARAAGLRYLQHIVAVTADIDGDHLVYHADPTDLDTGGHAKVHADVIVFATRTGADHD